MASKISKVTWDHDAIRRWAEDRGGRPAAVKGTTRARGDAGILRIDFPGYSGKGTLRAITWDEFFDRFDGSNLAMIYEERTASGQRSNFNKLVDRDSVESEGGLTGKLRGMLAAAGLMSVKRRTTRARARKGATTARARRGTTGRARKSTTGRKSTRVTRKSPRRTTRAVTGRRRARVISSARTSRTRPSARPGTRRRRARRGTRTTTRRR